VGPPRRQIPPYSMKYEEATGTGTKRVRVSCVRQHVRESDAGFTPGSKLSKEGPITPDNWWVADLKTYGRE
jgi:hypothetical protein